jgi:Protein of unknown function (DUF1194)/PEP-CTERM motif
MKHSFVLAFLAAGILAVGPQSAQAVPVDLELVLAADTSGSVDGVDFALQRAGFEAAFRSAAVIAAIESGAIGSIAVTLVDFANSQSVAVPWTQISDAASSNAFADLIAAAGRVNDGINDGQSDLIDFALNSLNTNDFEGTRSLLDIASEGAQDINGCSFNNVNCPTVQASRDAFLAGGGTAINAIWLNDRNFFGLDPTDIINAFEYGSLNVIGGPGSFQVFAQDFVAFGPAIQGKLLREINPDPVIPEPGTVALLGLGLLALAGLRRRSTR